MTTAIRGEVPRQRTATVRKERENGCVVVARTKPGGACDWFTYHLTRRGARRAARLYVRTGKVRGIRP